MQAKLSTCCASMHEYHDDDRDSPASSVIMSARRQAQGKLLHMFNQILFHITPMKLLTTALVSISVCAWTDRSVAIFGVLTETALCFRRLVVAQMHDSEQRLLQLQEEQRGISSMAKQLFAVARENRHAIRLRLLGGIHFPLSLASLPPSPCLCYA